MALCYAFFGVAGVGLSSIVRLPTPQCNAYWISCYFRKPASFLSILQALIYIYIYIYIYSIGVVSEGGGKQSTELSNNKY